MGGQARDLEQDQDRPDAEREPAPAAAPPNPVQRILAMQKGAGNQAVARFIDQSAFSGAMERAGQLAGAAGEAIAAATPKAKAAKAIYEALEWTNDNELLLQAMYGRSRAEMQEIDKAFQALYGQTIPAYLQDQLSTDHLVRAMALFHGTPMDGQHTTIALSLIAGINPEDALKQLERSTFDGREEIERRYDRCFAELGEGSLRADLENALWGVDEERALILLDNQMTPAIELYLDSVAMTGRTNTAKVLARFAQVYEAKGPAGVAELEKDWDTNVLGWYTDLSLYEAMDGELSGDAWDKVKAYLDGGDALEVGKDVGALLDELTGGAGFTADELARLKTEKDLLAVATEGGVTGIGFDREATFAATDRIRAIYDERKARLLGRADLGDDRRKELEQRLDAQWKAEREALRGQLREEPTYRADSEEIRVSLDSPRTDADKLYVAFERGDPARALKVVRDVWLAGGIHKLREDAATAVREDERLVRPAYSPDRKLTLSYTSEEWAPVRILIEETWPRVSGGALIHHYLEQASSDSDLKPLIDFLTGVPAGLRDASVEWALTLHGIPAAGPPGRTLAQWVAENVEEGSNAVRLAEVVDPAAAVADPAARTRMQAERARTRLGAQERGPMAEVLGVGYGREDDHARLYDSSQQSIERLDWLAEQYESRSARDALLAAGEMLGYDLSGVLAGGGGDRYMKQIAQMYGDDPASEEAIGALGDKEYDAFGGRVDQLAAARQQQAKVAALMATLAADAVITAITAGTYAPALLAALGGAVAGIVTQEAALGTEYELASSENAQAVAVAVATAGVKTGYGQLLKTELGALDKLGMREQMLIEASKDLAGGLSESTFSTMLSGKLPTEQEIAHAAAQRVFGMASAAGGKKFDTWREPPEGALLTISQQLRREVVNRGAPAAWNAIGTAALTAGKDGFGEGTGLEWTAGVVGEALKGFTSSIQDTIKTRVTEALAGPRSEAAHERFYEKLMAGLSASGDEA